MKNKSFNLLIFTVVAFLGFLTASIVFICQGELVKAIVELFFTIVWGIILGIQLEKLYAEYKFVRFMKMLVEKYDKETEEQQKAKELDPFGEFTTDNIQELKAQIANSERDLFKGNNNAD